jgi:hypothetical protein
VREHDRPACPLLKEGSSPDDADAVDRYFNETSVPFSRKPNIEVACYKGESDAEVVRPDAERVDPAWMRRIDDRHRKQDDLPSRAEAIRRLVELGLRIRVSGR